MLRRLRPVRRFRALVSADPTGVRAGFVALLLSSGGDLLAGLTLGSITGTLERLPGLLVLVPAAIGMRGNIFGALGSRLGTAIHAGTFRLSRRADTLVGQNLVASLALSLSISLVLAVLAKAIAVGFNLQNTISVVDFVVISVIGAVLSSVVVLALTVGVASLSARRGYDLDNVAGPIVTAAGDMVTLPALFLATYLVGVPWVTPVVAALCTVAGIVSLVLSLRAKLPILRRIVRESIPDPHARGNRRHHRRPHDREALLVVPRLSRRCSCWSRRSSRTPGRSAPSSAPASRPSCTSARSTRRGKSLRAISEDVLLVYVYAVPVFFFLGVSADIASAIAGLAQPGRPRDDRRLDARGRRSRRPSPSSSGTTAPWRAYRLGLDPDNHGIPIVTSSLDLLGALSLILAIVLLGLS